MSGRKIGRAAEYDFSNYTGETSTAEFRFEPTCLADYIAAWLRCGRGVRACHGDFQTFLIVLAVLIDNWISDETSLDYIQDLPGDDHEVIPRRVTSIFGVNGYDHSILDQDFFARCTFKELHGKEDDPVFLGY